MPHTAPYTFRRLRFAPSLTAAPVLACLIAIAGCAGQPAGPQRAAEEVSVEAATVQRMAARFAPVEIGADVSFLPANERQALRKLVEAGWLFDGLFLRQVWSGNEGILMKLLADESESGRARLDYFLINKGPWSRLDHNAAFVPGVPEKPASANFYPQGTTKEEVAAWYKSLPDLERAAATGFFTIIRRGPGGKGFEAVPYSIVYRDTLERAAALLRDAAALTSQPTLRRFLELRADSFSSNDYYESDVAWMELDASIEPTIGPYEVYEDEWFNQKAAFEAFITLRDDIETSKLVKFGAELQDVEDHLPVDPALRNPKLGGLAPIRVVNVVLAAGDGNRGVQTAAFNLPNDERVVREKGAKRVMLKNVQEAKFQKALVPISRIVLPAADQPKVDFNAFFTHILMHELMHGLGPHQITVGNRKTTVRQELKETYSTIEEAKADVSGLFALQYLIDKGVVEKDMEATLYDTFLASAFRSVRFGVSEAHGRGMAIQLNSLLDAGAITAKDGVFSVNRDKIKPAVVALTRQLMTLQGRGDYAAARDICDRLGVVRPEVQAAIDRLRDVPVDIRPRFTTALELAANRR
ncbi:MAG: hypothetical protein ACE148_04800 [Vicinamibacterales bacterium]